jgi:hypothetical protein
LFVTAVSYDQMRLMPVGLLAQLEAMNLGRAPDDRTFRRHERASGDLLHRIVESAMVSKLTPNDVLGALKRRLRIGD